jgi:hypothetical protein
MTKIQNLFIIRDWNLDIICYLVLGILLAQGFTVIR